MRKLFYTIGFILSLSIYGCGGGKQPSAQESTPPITAIEQKEDANEDTIADKSTKKSILIIREDLNFAEDLSVYRDTLVGRFNGKNIDTLICEPIGPPSPAEDGIYGGQYYKWRVYTTKHTVKDLILNNTTGIQFIKEGDLDRNGTDEWSYITQWPTSNWMRFAIFTYRDGEWDYLTDPNSIWRGHADISDLASCNGLARRAKKPGYIHVKFSDIRNNGGDFVLIDTLVQVNSWNMQKQE